MRIPKTTKWFFLAVALVILCGCTSKEEIKITHYPFIGEPEDRWGLIGTDGKVLIEDEFKEEPSLAVNGMFFVNSNGKVEMYSIDNPTKPIGDAYKEIAYFVNDLAPCVKANEGIKYIDKRGNVKFELPSEYVSANMFINGYSLIARNVCYWNEYWNEERFRQEWDAVNTIGAITRFEDYSIERVLADGTFLVTESGDDYEENYLIINQDGSVKTKLKDYDSHDENKDDFISPDLKYYIYYDDGESNYGVKSMDGETILKAKYEKIYFLKNGKLLFSKGGRLGVMDIKGNELLKPKYDLVLQSDDDEYLVMKDERMALLNEKEERLLGYEHDLLFGLSKNVFAAIDDGNLPEIEIITKNGKAIRTISNIHLNINDINTKDANGSVRSDYFDVKNLMESVLFPYNHSYTVDNLYGFLGLSPTVCNSKWRTQFSVSDIMGTVGNEWLPTINWGINEYGQISYSLHFDQVVDLIAYWWGEKQFMDSPCNGMIVKMKLNEKSREHFVSIEKELETAMKALGFEIDGDYSDGFNFKNESVYVSVELSDNSIIECIVTPKSTVDNSQNSDDALSSYTCYNLIGKIAGSDVHMTMIDDGFDVWGRYYYDSQREKGSDAYMSFVGDFYETNVELTEYYSDINKPTGTYIGEWKGDMICGTFIRAKDGKKFDFSLVIAHGDEDSFFDKEELINYGEEMFPDP